MIGITKGFSETSTIDCATDRSPVTIYGLAAVPR